jgi:stage II sporulation protein GA (sporulation sigma-E factor processing peptidase)
MGNGYIYLDLLWLQNLIMNFLLLFTTSKCTRIKTGLLRLLLSATLGALYAVAAILPQASMLQSMFVRILVPIVMLIVAFGLTDMKKFIRLTAVFYGVAFLFAGASFGLYYLFETENILSGDIATEKFPLHLLAAASFISIAIFRLIWSVTRIKASDCESLYKIEVSFGGETISMEALLDTGNRLIDPLSRYPVIVVEFDGIKDALLPEVKLLFEQSLENNFEAITRHIAASPWIGRFRMIPFSALEKKDGMLIGFKPDRVRVLMSNIWHEIENVVIAIYNHKLCQNSRYRALLHPGIIIS